MSNTFPGRIQYAYDSSMESTSESSSIVGLFEMKTPLFMVRHPDLVRQILISDFDHFVNHRKVFDLDHDALLGIPFSQ
uniref:Cytochrome P450 n=1 Tax=Megaselia scalaris TaxID=36166 RepID=T1H0G0_MEGSC